MFGRESPTDTQTQKTLCSQAVYVLLARTHCWEEMTPFLMNNTCAPPLHPHLPHNNVHDAGELAEPKVKWNLVATQRLLAKCASLMLLLKRSKISPSSALLKTKERDRHSAQTYRTATTYWSFGDHCLMKFSNNLLWDR